jgi:hypothetical protein
MTGRHFGLIPLLTMGIVFFGIVLDIKAFADDFADQGLRFDGKITRGKLDHNNNLGFSGRAKWDGQLAVRFSPIVRAQFNIAPFIETEADGILGAYSVTLTFDSKTRDVSYQNLRIKILNREGDEIASSGMVSRSGSGWVIGIATEQIPFDIHISYSSEKGSILMPAVSEGKDDL